MTADTAEAVVVATGDRTELGRIAVHLRLAPRVPQLITRLDTEMGG